MLFRQYAVQCCKLKKTLKNLIKNKYTLILILCAFFSTQS
jgi:hypothetical protein